MCSAALPGCASSAVAEALVSRSTFPRSSVIRLRTCDGDGGSSLHAAVPSATRAAAKIGLRMGPTTHQAKCHPPMQRRVTPLAGACPDGSRSRECHVNERTRLTTDRWASFDTHAVFGEQVAGERLHARLRFVPVDDRLGLAQLGLAELLLTVEDVEVRRLAEVEPIGLD